MSRRRGELTSRRIDRDWPHQVDIIGSLVSLHYDAIHACGLGSMAPRGGRSSFQRDHSYCRFAFSDPADADAFQFRFGGRRVTIRRVKNRMVDDWRPLGEPPLLRKRSR